ncbi:MAG: hypothetical protein WA918_03440 [Erythrobacter sp.]
MTSTARDAATQPLRDVNIVRSKVQPQVARVLDDPYGFDRPKTCGNLAWEILQLNKALGPDFDVDLEEPGKNKKRANTALRLAGRIGSGLLLPFRGVVREVSGSAANEREYRAATLVGVARRSYLKGIAVEKGCRVPVRLADATPPPGEDTDQ